MGEGKESFGFTRGDDVDQDGADRRAAAAIRREPSNPRPEAYPEAYGRVAERPRWLSLLVGVLLGAGGTLLTSTLWLPHMTNQSLAHHVEGHGNDAAKDASQVMDPERTWREDELKGQTAADHLGTPQLIETEVALLTSGQLENGLDTSFLRPDDTAPNPLPERLNQAHLVSSEEPSELFSDRFDDSAGLYRVQLAAVDSETDAWIYWREMNERLPGIFTDVVPVFNERMIDERRYLRIWVGAFTDQTDAISYCDWLKEQEQDCFVFRANKV